MWHNAKWALRHIKKHAVSLEETWEVFEECQRPLLVLDQLRFPPFRRYWTIGFTKEKRILEVVWERHREVLHLVTAFEPNEERIKIYERKTKKIIKR